MQFLCRIVYKDAAREETDSLQGSQVHTIKCIIQSPDPSK